MTLDIKSSDVQFESCPYGASARRFLEHVESGQVNPFGRSLSTVLSLKDASGLIDIARTDTAEGVITGLTLADLEGSGRSTSMFREYHDAVQIAAEQRPVRVLIAEVLASAKRFAAKRAI